MSKNRKWVSPFAVKNAPLPNKDIQVVRLPNHAKTLFDRVQRAQLIQARGPVRKVV